jgi:outer membrane protein
MVRLASLIVATLLTLLSTVARAADQQDLPKQLTLSQAITIALANNSILRTAQSSLEQASGRYEQSRSLLLPQLDLDARQGYLTINLIGLGIDIPSVPQGKTGPFASMDARLRLSQDLLNIANRQAWKSSSSRRESSRLLVDNAREIVVLDVVATYLQALKAKASRDTLAEETKLANDLYSLTEDRVKQGVAAALESNRAQQQVNSLQQQQQEAEQSYIAAKLSLANALQQRITSDFEVDDPAAYGIDTKVDRDTALQSALALRQDYRSLEANVRAAELQVKSVKAYRLPTATASFSDGQSGATPASNVNTYRLTGLVCASGCSRSRDHDYSQPPPQIRTSGFPASGLPQVMTPGRRGGNG